MELSPKRKALHGLARLDVSYQKARMFCTPILFIPSEEALLGNAERSTFTNLSELQWELIARCWRNNIDVWQPEWNWFYSPMLFFSHWFYARWKHGNRATIPMMHLAGFSDSSIPVKVMKKCNVTPCQSGLDGALEKIRSGLMEINR